jgi:uncharacterized HhH-GPD family protein
MGKPGSTSCALVLAQHYDGDATNIWAGVSSGDALYRRLRDLPGFGEEKSKIFVALLAKRRACETPGWKTAAGKFGDASPRSVADVHDRTSLGKVREWKKAQKAAKKDKQDRPV